MEMNWDNGNGDKTGDESFANCNVQDIIYTPRFYWKARYLLFLHFSKITLLKFFASFSRIFNYFKVENRVMKILKIT